MNSQLILLGRILLAVLFLVAGFGKLTAAEGFAGALAARGFPSPLAMAYLVGACEMIGGICTVVGFQTRIVSILLALFCVATGLMAHLGDSTELMKNIGLAGGFLVLAGAGPGSIAVNKS